MVFRVVSFSFPIRDFKLTLIKSSGI